MRNAPAGQPVGVGDLGPLVASWPVDKVATGFTGPESTIGLAGDPGWLTPIASVTKLLAGFAAMVALEEGTIDLDEPAGPPGSTVRHLLAHASGLSFKENRTISPPGRRRIYSNPGIERFAEHLAQRANMPFEEYLRLGVLEPLGMTHTELRGSPAGGAWSTVADLLLFSRELLEPTLVSPATLAEATRPHFPDLAKRAPGRRAVRPEPLGPHVRDP